VKKKIPALNWCVWTETVSGCKKIDHKKGVQGAKCPDCKKPIYLVSKQ